MDKKKIITGIIGVFGILFMIWGIYTFNHGVKGLNDVTVYNGKLNIVENAMDDEFGFEIDSPVLIRKVEMYQYLAVNKHLEKEFSDSWHAGILVNPITQKLADKNDKDNAVHYDNPPFPKEPINEIICGKIRIGEDGPFLDSEFIEKLSYESYSDFKNQHELVQINGLQNNGEVLGLHPINDSTYANRNGDWEIGDVRVTWYTVDPATFAEEYTVAGKVSGDHLGVSDSGIFFYDYRLTAEEISNKFSSGNKITGIILSLVGLITTIICIVLVIKKKP